MVILSKKSERGERAINVLKNLQETNIQISSIVYEEVLYVVLKQLYLDQLPSIHPLSQFPVIPFSKEDAELAASIGIGMERQGKKKPRGDILIAAVAINQNAKLFTFNEKHYSDVPDLQHIS